MLYLKLYYKMLEWEWYSDANVMRLFIHCLLKANRKEKKWQGVIIKPGSFITSYENLSHELGLTVHQIRTALNKLKMTGEVANKTTSRYSMITVKNWNDYQVNGKQNGNQMANEWQTDGKQMATTRECKNEENEENVFFISEKKLDPYINPVVENFKSEHLKIFGQKVYLDAQQRQRIMELNAEIDGFTDTIPEAFNKLKNIDFDLPNFNPNGVWLLRENNYTNVLNGLYNGKQKQDIWEELREKERLRNGTT